MFNETFKFYKSKCPPPDLKNVVDFDYPSNLFHSIKLNEKCDQEVKSTFPGLVPINKWKLFELNNHPGLVFIRNPFTGHGQRYWIAKCLRDYPRRPHIVNIRNNKLIPSEAINDWWEYLHKTGVPVEEKQRIQIAMRWITLGYHHDWDTKLYCEERKHQFPIDLSEISRCIADVLDYRNYSAEAAIVNFYPIGSTLSGHTDHSENDLNAPIISFSFGQTAIFLIGGETKDIIPTAIYLKSGDIVVMSKKSRLCYHAVPKILSESDKPWSMNEDCDSDSDQSILDNDLWKSCDNSLNEFWKDFDDYVSDCRININVRQVLRNGQTKL